MDDPWGSPWATDPPPKIELPPGEKDAAPEDAAAWKGADDDDAWGGWSGRPADSPAWGRSPALKPLEGDGEAWDKWKKSDEGAEEGEVVDSAVSMGEEPSSRDDALGRISVEVTTPPDLQASTDDLSEQENGFQPVQTDVNGTSAADDQASESTGPEEPEAADGNKRPEPTRQASKVQELVEMYDDISMSAASPVFSPGGEPEEQVKRRHSAEVVATVDEEVPTGMPAISPGTELDGKEASTQESDSDAGDVRQPTEESTQDNGAHEHVSDLSKLQPPPPFDIDLSRLHALFPPDTSTTVADPEPVPDVIIGDTFAAVSERKAWHLVSRRGSVRKHALGADDDSYVHVTWASAHQTRLQTLTTVRRWMEEDSIAGRVVWGRRKGAVGAHMFNWDSDAPQEEISELLGRRRPPRERQLSGAARDLAASPSEVVAFGWSSSMPSSPTGAAPQSPETPSRHGHAASPKDARVAALGKASQRPQSWNGALLPPPAAKKASEALQTIQATEEEDDDDDDWGEMVSSPTDAAFGSLSTDAAIGHLDEIVTSPVPGHDVSEPNSPETTDTVKTSAIPDRMDRCVPVDPLINNDDDETVSEILRSLPDFSYMLK